MSEPHWSALRFYRDPHNAKFMGVCAGIADYFGWNVRLVRVLVVVAFFWFNVVTIVTYLALGFLLPVKPEKLYDWDADDEYWRSVRRSASETFRDVRHRFREMDVRMQRMERYVTSSQYDLDREFRQLED